VFDLTTCVLGRFNSAPSDSSVTWSPDGAKLAFVRLYAASPDAGSDVFILDLQNGFETQVSFTPDDRKFDLSWSPDGSALAFYSRPAKGEDTSPEAGLWVLELSTLRQRMLYADPYHYCLQSWSPDSSAIALGCTQREFYLIDVASGERRVLDERYGFGNPAWSPNGEMIAYSCDNDTSGPYFACVIRADGSGRVMFPDHGGWAIWSFDGDQVVLYGGGKLLFGDPETGGYVRVVEGWQGGTPEIFLSERVLSGFLCGPATPCGPRRIVTDIESGKSIESPLAGGAEWSPNRRYLAFAIGNYGIGIA